MTQEELARKAAEGADRFSAMVRTVDEVELDFSRASVDRLSALVSANRSQWLEQFDETERRRFTELMGCYFGECVRRLNDGTWVWWGEDAAVQVDGAGDEVHFALPFANVSLHFQQGEGKSLAMIYNGFEALVRGDMRD